MRICEIFYSIAGEGRSVGRPVVFVRLAGCNLKCEFCDSKYALEPGREYTTNKIVKEIRSYPTKHVVWTGGEPTLQDKLIEEVIMRMPKNYIHEIETNGTTVFDTELFRIVNISPKKENLKKNILLDMSFHRKKVFFKFVIEDEKNYEFWKKLIKELDLNYENVYMMPEGADRKTVLRNSKWLIEKCKKDNFKFTPRLQIHYWDSKRGV